MTLEEQINLLKSAALEDSKNKKEALSSAGHAIESLIRLEKEYTGLRSDLSLCLEHSTRQFKSCSLKLKTIRHLNLLKSSNDWDPATTVKSNLR